MKQFLIVLLVAGGIHVAFPADETKCNAIETACPCSPLLDGDVYIQVMTNASGYKMRFFKEYPNRTITVLSLRKDKVKIENAFRDRVEFTINNGTIKFISVKMDDSGQYRIEVFGQDGKQVKDVNFKLDVKGSTKEDSFNLLIPVCAALGALLIIVACCFGCRERKHRKKPGKTKHGNS